MLADMQPGAVAPYGRQYWLAYDKTYIHIVRCRNDNECSESLTERIRLFVRDQDRVREFQQSSL